MPAETHRRGSAERSEVERVVLDALADVVGTPSALDSRLRDDLGLDDIGVLDLVDEVEHAIGDRTVGGIVNDEDLDEILTVGDLVDVVTAWLQP